MTVRGAALISADSQAENADVAEPDNAEVADRPYRDMTEPQLIIQCLNFERTIQNHDREKREYERLNPSDYWQNDAYLDIQDKVKRASDALWATKDELNTRPRIF